MVRGLYTAYTGMLNEQNRLDVISNNLANASTIGYKQTGLTNQSFSELLTVKIRDGSENYANKNLGTMSVGVKTGEEYTNYEQGSLRATSNTYDLALSGKGFFTVKYIDNAGTESIKYVRDGVFMLNSQGYLVDSTGNRVQGTGGDILISGNPSKVSIDESGVISADGQVVEQLNVADFEDYSFLEKFGDNMYSAVEGATEKKSTAQVMQGFTEQSNVNVVAEMVQMINITRAYEANSKVMKTVDSMLEKSVNSVGKV